MTCLLTRDASSELIFSIIVYTLFESWQCLDALEECETYKEIIIIIE